MTIVKSMFENPPRTGEVEAAAGDYGSELIGNEASAPGESAREVFDLMWSRMSDQCVSTTKDLAPLYEGLQTAVVGLQGRPIAPLVPNDGDRLTWSASRGRWEPKAPPPQRVKPPPPPPIPVAALLPAGWNGATFQYSLLRSVVNTRMLEVDNRGLGPAAQLYTQNNILTDTQGWTIPDLIPKQCCSSVTSGNSFFVLGVRPELAVSTAITVILRAARVPAWSGSSYSGLAVCGDADLSAADSSTASGNFSWSLLAQPAPGSGTAALRYLAHNGVQSPITFTSSLIPKWTGSWEVVSLRRNDAGTVVRLGKNKIYESSGELPPPTGGERGRLSIGNIQAGEWLTRFPGSYADFTFIPRYLSDGEIDTATDLMLGV